MKVKLTRCSGRSDVGYNSERVVIDEFSFGGFFLAWLFGVTSPEMRKASERDRCGEVSGVQFLTDGA